MPAGIPVATVAIGNARNAGLLAVRILATGDEKLRAAMERYQADLAEQVRDKDAKLREQFDAPELRPAYSCSIARSTSSSRRAARGQARPRQRRDTR